MRKRIAVMACAASLAWAAGVKDAVKRNLGKARDHLEELDEAVGDGQKAEAPLPGDPAELAKLLGDPSVERRDAAQKALEAQGEKAEPALKEAARSQDPEVRERASKLLAALEGKRGAAKQERLDARLKEAELVLEIPGPCRAGEPVRFRAVLRNASREPLGVLKCRTTSASGQVDPSVALEMKDASGRKAETAGAVSSDAAPRPAAAEDVVELKPGAEADLFAAVEGLRFPRAPGRYTAVLVYRIGGQGLPGLPRGEVRSDPVEVEVAD